MLNKLLANLPFNPSLIGQISFYAKRLRRENSVRRLGFVMLLLAMMVQLFAFMSPSEASVQCSTNDIIRCGFQTPEQAALWCIDPNKDIGAIIAYYGLTCTDVSTADTVYIKSSDSDGRLDSLGRNPVSIPSPRNGGNWDIYTVAIPGVADPLWMKDLQYWDSAGASTYKVLYMTNKYGQVIYMMYDCGNIVTTDHFSPPIEKPPETPPPVVLPPSISCSNLFMTPVDGSKLKLGHKVIVTGQAAGQNIPTGQKVDMYYEFVDANGKVVDKDQALGVAFQGNVADDSNGHAFSSNETGNYSIRLTVKYDGKVASGSASGNCVKHITVERPCEGVISTGELEKCLDKSKSAKNTTQQLPDAQTKPAKAGDVIVYSLSVKNTGAVTVPKFIIKENLNDVLDYAGVSDYGGGQLDNNNYIYWPAVDVKPGQTITKQFSVKIKDPIPGTPTSTSDRGHFDCLIVNEYQDTVSIHVQCSVPKQIETKATSLPNTGPGTSALIALGLTVVVGYFFARSRLLSKEVDLVRNDYAATGGI